MAAGNTEGLSSIKEIVLRAEMTPLLMFSDVFVNNIFPKITFPHPLNVSVPFPSLTSEENNSKEIYF